MNTMTDAELLKTVMEKNNWTQEQLASELLFNRSQVSRVINGKIGLRPLTRKKAGELLEQTE